MSTQDDNAQVPAVIEHQPGHIATRFDREAIELIKTTIFPDASDGELRLFLTVASKTGLDPFARQIHPVKREGKLCIQTGIDGYRLIAERTGGLDGQEGPEWSDDEGNWSNVWTGDLPPHAARVMVYRKGHSRPYTGIAHFAGYVQTRKADGAPVKRWRDDPAGMLAKCAEALALRKAFPQELSGLYADVEMDQAGNEPTAPRVAMPQRRRPEGQQAQKPAQAAPAAQSGPPATSEWEGVSEVRILEVEQKPGENRDGPWLLTKAKADDGKEYRTFSTSFGAILRACAGTGETVHIEWKIGRYGPEIKKGDDSLWVVEPEDNPPAQ